MIYYLLLGVFWILQFDNTFSISIKATKCSQRLFEAKGNPAPGSNGFSIEVNEAPTGLDEISKDGDDGLEVENLNREDFLNFLGSKME
jgi:hypothetical protein